MTKILRKPVQSTVSGQIKMKLVNGVTNLVTKRQKFQLQNSWAASITCCLPWTHQQNHT